MSLVYPFALALAAALFDVTLGYPAGLARWIGTPSGWIETWLRIFLAATGGRGGRGALLAALAPVAVAAAVVTQFLPDGPIGFVASAWLASTLCGRQRLDARAREAVRVWEAEGPYVALAAAEALHADEGEARLERAAGSALAARFADEVAAPTLFILIGGPIGAALCRTLVLAGRSCRQRRDVTPFGHAVAELERWTIAPAARLGALFLALAAGPRPSAWRAVAGPATRPTAPAEAVALAAVRPNPDGAAYLRRALALYRRAAAAELITLAALAFVAAFAL